MRSTPVRRQGQPRTKFGNAVQIRVSELDHRRLRLRPHRCTIITSHTLQQNPRGADNLCQIYLTKDIRAYPAVVAKHGAGVSEMPIGGMRFAFPPYALPAIRRKSFISTNILNGSL